MFKKFPVVITDRIMLRELHIADIQDLFEIFSDIEVLKYYDILPHTNINETEKLFLTFSENYKSGKAIRWGIVNLTNNKLVGTCGFHNFDDSLTRTEIGYELNRSYWKQGFMYEAINEIIKIGFADGCLNRIEGIIDNENEDSKSVLSKLGFKYEGCLRQRFYFNGEFRDENYFGLLKSEWGEGDR